MVTVFTLNFLPYKPTGPVSSNIYMSYIYILTPGYAIKTNKGLSCMQNLIKCISKASVETLLTCTSKW